jgi:uncharacterized protein (DUF427 family)
VVFNGVVIADSRQTVRVLETGHPPVYYVPPEDVLIESLEGSDLTTQCEFKGQASYYHVVVGEKRATNGAWAYPEPERPYDRMKGYLAFYPNLMDACMVDGEKVRPEPGDFYGGWITSDIAGPFKEEAGAGSAEAES